jgi:hypothetical protein
MPKKDKEEGKSVPRKEARQEAKKMKWSVRKTLPATVIHSKQTHLTIVKHP